MQRRGFGRQAQAETQLARRGRSSVGLRVVGDELQLQGAGIAERGAPRIDRAAGAGDRSRHTGQQRDEFGQQPVPAEGRVAQHGAVHLGKSAGRVGEEALGIDAVRPARQRLRRVPRIARRCEAGQCREMCRHAAVAQRRIDRGRDQAAGRRGHTVGVGEVEHRIAGTEEAHALQFEAWLQCRTVESQAGNDGADAQIVVRRDDTRRFAKRHEASVAVAVDAQVGEGLGQHLRTCTAGERDVGERRAGFEPEAHATDQVRQAQREADAQLAVGARDGQAQLRCRRPERNERDAERLGGGDALDRRRGREQRAEQTREVAQPGFDRWRAALEQACEPALHGGRVLRRMHEGEGRDLVLGQAEQANCVLHRGGGNRVLCHDLLEQPGQQVRNIGAERCGVEQLVDGRLAVERQTFEHEAHRHLRRAHLDLDIDGAQ